jgi:hypothetical protein
MSNPYHITEPQPHIQEQRNNHRIRGLVAAVAIAVTSLAGSGQIDASPDTEPVPIEAEPSNRGQENIITIEKPAPELPRPIINVEHQEAEQGKTSVAFDDLHTSNQLDGINSAASVNYPSATRMDQVTPGLDKLPEFGGIPEARRETLEKNAAFIPELGCSAYLIRNKEDVVIGASVAEHCNLRGEDRERIVDVETDQVYVEFYNGLEVYATGDDNFELAGSVESMLLPPEDDTKQDLALLVFGDNDPQEIYDSYNGRVELERGEKAYFTARPAHQETDSGINRQQYHTMIYLGKNVTYTTLGESIAVDIFAMHLSEDKAACTPRASGGSAITESDEEIGTLAIYNEFNPITFHPDQDSADATQRYYEQVFGYDLRTADAICGFSGKNLAFADMQKVEVREFTDSEVDTEMKELVEDRAIAEFNDPSVSKEFIDGSIQVYKSSETSLGGPILTEVIQIENPLLYSDESGTLLYWMDGDAKSTINSEFFPAREGLYTTVYREPGATDEDGVFETVGRLELRQADDGDTILVDESGQKLRGMVPDTNTDSREEWYMIRDQGEEVRLIQPVIA